MSAIFGENLCRFAQKQSFFRSKIALFAPKLIGNKAKKQNIANDITARKSQNHKNIRTNLAREIREIRGQSTCGDPGSILNLPSSKLTRPFPPYKPCNRRASLRGRRGHPKPTFEWRDLLVYLGMYAQGGESYCSTLQVARATDGLISWQGVRALLTLVWQGRLHIRLPTEGE